MKRTILAAGALILAATSIPAHADGTVKLQETVRPVFEHELPNVPGKSLIAFEVQYPAGGASPSHTHPKSAFIYAYVLSGEIVSAVDNEESRIYRAGEGWYEVPGAHHRVSRNASKTSPAKLLAIFVMDPGERQVVFPDAK
ncbi:MAG TPA: cupin domain-containing protein [Burkholderiales bacterium]|jgi:quercetin dioxygenase-like cupin family protein|nr:cupin domain-containing protein [Burkholderiales bacterium]